MWNLIKHEKPKYRNFMNIVCQMDEDDEYSLHYEFSDRITKADKHNVAALMKNVLQRGNPFNLEQPKSIINIATGAIFTSYEISPICFFLTKGGLIRKANKSELITELKSKITKNIPTHLPPTNHPRNVIMDFMAYARKVPIKMQNLKTYNNFFISLWSTISFLFKSCNGWILFLICTKKTTSKEVNEDEEQQVKAYKQLFQILINLYLWKLIDSGLYQRIRQHYNNSSQTGYSTRLKVNNLINRSS